MGWLVGWLAGFMFGSLSTQLQWIFRIQFYSKTLIIPQGAIFVVVMHYKIATVTHLESHATKIAVSPLESGEQCCIKAIIIIISFHAGGRG